MTSVRLLLAVASDQESKRPVTHMPPLRNGNGRSGRDNPDKSKAFAILLEKVYATNEIVVEQILHQKN